MVYLEAPAGVGFSYSPDKNYTTNDDIVRHIVTVRSTYRGRGLGVALASSPAVMKYNESILCLKN